MKALLSDDLWRELAARSAGHKRIRAAIAYVTARYLEFRHGDLLVCDASDTAIKSGMTSASVLRSFANEGADLYSYDGLHSKVAVIDDLALIGSANLSENAGVNTCEASLLTDDLQITGLVQGFIEKVKNEAVLINSEYLARIELLPVVQNAGRPRQTKSAIDIGESRVWFVSTKELSDRLVSAEAEITERGMKAASELLKTEGYEIEWIRWHGKSRFRSEAKAGDLIIDAHTKKRGKRNYIQVFKAAPIIFRQDEGHWTRFFIEVPTEQTYYLWKDIKSDLASLGFLSLTPNSTRELTGKALGLLQLME